MIDLTLKLRPALAADFNVVDTQGTKRYLYGKIYCVKDGDRYSFNIFSRHKVAKLHFKECFKAGLVHVVDNVDEIGLIDTK